MKRSYWLLAVIVWMALAATAYYFRDALVASTIGKASLIILGFPIVILLWLAAEAIGEGVVLVILVSVFKVVTLGHVETEYTHLDVKFPWYGFTRTLSGTLIASENAICSVAIAALSILAATGYWLWYAHT